MSVRRIAAPLLLGTLVNIVVNLIFNPTKLHLPFTEFFWAWIFATPITELNRYLEIRLGKKYSWIAKPGLRLFTHFSYLALSLLAILNISGNIYLWLTSQGFFTWMELLIINLVTLGISILLTVANWGFDFYKRWRAAEYSIMDSSHEINHLRSQLNQSSNLIELQKGNTKFKIEANNIAAAIHTHGIVRVYAKDRQQGTFNGALSELSDRLPNHLFFLATRNTILNRNIIASITPATYGKLQVKIKDLILDEGDIVVSRLKASSFRKWYNSTSD